MKQNRSNFNKDNMKRISKLLCGLMYIGFLSACNNKPPQTLGELFPETVPLNEKRECLISEDSLGQVEGIVCDEENLVVFDTRSNQCFTLFDQQSGRQIGRFGNIGQGPLEILFGSSAYLANGCIVAYNDQSKTVVKYNLDSLRNGASDGAPVRLTKHQISDALISRLIPMNDSVFVAGGIYKSHYQHLIFDSNSQVLDYAINVYNVADSSFNVDTRFLSNQGYMAKHPVKNKFAYSINFSSNLDFFEVAGNKIKLIKSLRLGDPVYESLVEAKEQLFMARPTKETIHGFIELCATPKYVYALYSDGKIFEAPRETKIVLVFDWNGKPVKKLLLDTNAFHIAVNEKEQSLFAIVKNEEGGFSIISYAL